MTSDSANPLSPVCLKRLLQACAILAFAQFAAFPLFAWFGFRQHGESGLFAAAVAGGICLVAGQLALLATGLLHGSLALHGLLVSMVFRMGLPIVAGILLTNQGGPLAEAGVFGLIVGYYLLTLVIETPLSVRLVPRDAVAP